MTGDFQVKGGMYLPKFIGWGAVVGLGMNIFYMAYTYGTLSERFVHTQDDIAEIKRAYQDQSRVLQSLSEKVVVLQSQVKDLKK